MMYSNHNGQANIDLRCFAKYKNWDPKSYLFSNLPCSLFYKKKYDYIVIISILQNDWLREEIRDCVLQKHPKLLQRLVLNTNILCIAVRVIHIKQFASTLYLNCTILQLFIGVMHILYKASCKYYTRCRGVPWHLLSTPVLVLDLCASLRPPHQSRPHPTAYIKETPTPRAHSVTLRHTRESEKKRFS